MKPNDIGPPIVEFDKECVLVEHFLDHAFTLLLLIFLIHHEIRGQQG